MSGAIKTGGTAFPMQDGQAIHAYAMGRTAAMADAPVKERDRAYLEARAEAVGGMTLRDYFAAKALPAILDGSWPDLQLSPVSGLSPVENSAVFAYVVADAMLKAREGGAA